MMNLAMYISFYNIQYFWQIFYNIDGCHIGGYIAGLNSFHIYPFLSIFKMLDCKQKTDKNIYFTYTFKIYFNVIFPSVSCNLPGF